MNYNYTTDGKLYTRTWARTSGENPLTTTYSYDNNTGEQTGIDYSDNTQDITFSYTRTGQKYQVTDSVGTRTFVYNSALQPNTETIVGGLYNKTITKDYATTGVIGRYAELHIGTEYDLEYAYDSYGRFNTITNGSDTYTYAYLTNSDLIDTLTYPNNIKVDYGYESNRDLVTQVKNTHNTTTTISQYDYTYDAISRRNDVYWSGTAFSNTDSVTYGYNDRSELISADATANANYNFAFNFDNIGNRSNYTTFETGSSVTSAYTVNNLNQYTAITNPTQSPTYNDDGAMLNDGTWDFTWNAENRLVIAEKSDAKLEFKYDYMGRRVEKKVYSGSTGNWTLDTHLKLVYDGYEQIEELDGANNDAILKKRIWGLNKLIATVNGSTTYYALGDANKNITEYLDSAGIIQAHYEYSPFGKITRKTGAMQDDFDFRFSSEYYDSETGFVYYNYRYYSSSLGRWLSRDPIEEEGGYNLYGFIDNDGVNAWDELGLEKCSECDGSYKEQQEKKAKELQDIFDAYQKETDTEKKKRLLDKLKETKKEISDINKAIKDGTATAYGESANIYPQNKEGKKGIYNSNNYDPKSTKYLQDARRDMADVRSRNKHTAYIDKSKSNNSIEKRIWNNCKDAAGRAGNSLPKNVKHFYIRQENEGTQKPYWAGNKQPYKSYGPFRKAGGGGDVPQGNNTYIDFYQGVR